MISLSLAQLFVQVAKAGSIAAAARELNIAPSIATRRIAMLEQTLKTKLMIRTTRQLSLTEAGQALLQWAKPAIEGYEKLKDEIGAMQDRPSGTIRIACNHHAAVSYLPPILCKFCAKYPEVRLQLTTSAEPTELLEGTFDIIIHAGRVLDINLIGRRVLQYRLGLYASPAYIAHKGTPRKISDLADHNCLVSTTGEKLHWSFKHQGRISAQPIDAYIEVDTSASLKQFALLGAGIARLSQQLVENELKSGQLVEVLPDHLSVYADGELPSVWVGFPDRQVLHRTRLIADFLASELDELQGAAATRQRGK